MATVNIQVRANDLELIGQFIAGREDFELSYDEIKSKFRVPTPPNGTTNVAIVVPDTEILDIYKELRTNFICQTSNTISRLKTILLATANTLIITGVNDTDTADTSTLQVLRQSGRRKLTRT